MLPGSKSWTTRATVEQRGGSTDGSGRSRCKFTLAVNERLEPEDTPLDKEKHEPKPPIFWGSMLDF